MIYNPCNLFMFILSSLLLSWLSSCNPISLTLLGILIFDEFASMFSFEWLPFTCISMSPGFDWMAKECGFEWAWRKTFFNDDDLLFYLGTSRILSLRWVNTGIDLFMMSNYSWSLCETSLFRLAMTLSESDDCDVGWAGIVS